MYVRAPFKFPQQGGRRGLLPNLDLEVLHRISTHEDDPRSIFFLVNLDGLEIWSMLDLVTWKVSESGIGPPFGGCTCPCKEMERVKIVLQCKI